MSPLLLLLSALPAGDFAFTLEVGGAPVAQVELSVQPEALIYRRTFFFRRGPQHDEARFPRDGEALASFSLLAVPKPGCIDARDESSPSRGQVCVRFSSADAAEGTLFERPFKASYRDGVLQTLELPGSRYARGAARPGKDVFGAGYEIAGTRGAIGLEPKVEGARLRTVLTLNRPALSGSCLERAEAVRAQDPERFEVVLGLLEDAGRMWPHAWVRDRSLHTDWDPTVNGSDGRYYLELPKAQAGQLYLDLLDQKLRVVRR